MKDYTKDIGFWKRLQSFVSDVQTNCCMGEEEKQMIIHNCNIKILDIQSVSKSDTNMLHQKIEKLIPFISEEFITYLLWEEGKYIPFLKCWQKADNENKFSRLSNRLKKHFEKSGYEISFVPQEHRSVIHEFYIYPKYKELENGSYKFNKTDWSIEEMLDMLANVLK